MRPWLKIITVLISGFMLVSCMAYAPSRSYEDTHNNVQLLGHDSHNIDHIKPISTRVSAEKAWQNSRVFVQRGDTVTVNAHGSWSPWPEMSLWSGPDGNRNWSVEVSGINGSALMGRLGYQGKPFQIGRSRTFRATDYGMLYLAMNDSFKYLHDNKGDMNLEIFLDRNRNLSSASVRGTAPAYRVTAYNYNDSTGKGFIAAVVGERSFAVRRWLLNKIGEIASSKNVAIDARRNNAEGGAYRVTDEKVSNGILSIEFETIW